MIVKANEQSIKKAAELIKCGEVIAFPTETVYGLGADAFNELACQKIYQLKGRSTEKKLTLHVSSYQMIESVAEINSIADKLIKAFLPGPLTLILKSKSNSTVGIRMPDNDVALKLIELANRPIAAPSANPSNLNPPVTAEEVFDYFGNDILILDGGKCKFSLSSTIVDISSDEIKILRRGAINESDIFRVITND